MPEEIYADIYTPEPLAVNCHLWCTPRRSCAFPPAPTKFHCVQKSNVAAPHQSKIKDFCQLPPRGKPFLNARVQKTFPTVVDAPKYNAPHLALPLGELSPQVTERGGQWPLTMRACYPGGRLPPLGVTRFVTGWWVGNPLRHGLRRATSPIGRGKALPQLLIVHLQSSISHSRRNAAQKIWCLIFFPMKTFCEKACVCCRFAVTYIV